MSKAFDPYHAWLGIPPEKQPPNHYDLLGIPLFEDGPDVIEAAANRQMGHLRTYQTGKHGELSQRLLNEVAAARVCLLNAEKKARYDLELRIALDARGRTEPVGIRTAGAGNRFSPRLVAVVAALACAVSLLLGVMVAGRFIFPRRPGRTPPEQTVTHAPGNDLAIEPELQKEAGPPQTPGDGLLIGDRVSEDKPPGKELPGRTETTEALEPDTEPAAVSVGSSSPGKEPVVPEPAPDTVAAREAIEARYAAALRPAEAMVGAWDFRGAAAALSEITFDEEELAARVATRRDQVERMAGLKARMISKISNADPPLKKMDLMMRGVNGDVIRADEQGITARLITGKTESCPWKDLGSKAAGGLLQLVVDPQSADDWLSAGVFALGAGDAGSAEKFFAKARSLGAGTDAFLESLAAGVFAQAKALLEQREFARAEAAFSDLEARYADTSWFASHKAALEAARSEAKAGLLEAEAERLYAQAVKLFEENKLFDLRPAVEQLRTGYPNSPVVKDTARTPSFSKMEEAVADLGLFITVRKDGRGDFKTVGQALDAAISNSVIEIQDAGPYNESLEIAREKAGLVLRGGEGCWPLITSLGPNRDFHTLLKVSAPKVTLERLVLAHTAAGGHNPVCLSVRGGAGEFTARLCVMAGAYHVLMGNPGVKPQLENCVLFGSSGYMLGGLHMRNCLWIGRPERLDEPSEFENVLITGAIRVSAPCEFRCCTLCETFEPKGEPNLLADCIVHSVSSPQKATELDCCAFSDSRSPPVGRVRIGENCFPANPGFVNPDNFDYRLMPRSPCRGKASDGGDLGVRYTPQMAAMLKLAFELRSRGIIKF